MNILMVGDVYGEPGRQAIAKLLPRLRQEHAIDFAVVNVENSAGGFGVTAAIARQVLEAGADVMTSGNHIWDKREIVEYITKENLLLRPANFPAGTPGVGYVTVKTGPHKVAVLNLMGRVFMLPIDCPFRKADEIVPELRKETPIILVDMHCEATSESLAMGWYLDGRASAVVGTHRHVQTADERVLPGGTAYITDLGHHRADRRRHRRGPRSDHPALPQPDADSLRDRQRPRGPARSRDRSRARDRPRDVHSPAPRRGLILDGKVVAQKVLDDVRAGVVRLTDRAGVVPTLAVVLVGDFAPSKVYVANKKRAADTVGIASQDHIHPEGLDRASLLALLRRLNADPKIHAILLQLPLPAGLDEDEAIAAIAPEKDVDGLHPTNLGHLLAGTPSVVPCTPAGCLEILDHYGCDLKGAEAVVIGRSRLVGKPLASSCSRVTRPSPCATPARAISPRTRAGPTCCASRPAARAP